MKRLLIIASLFIPTVSSLAQFTQLEKEFLQPPSTIQTSVYWYWISGDISREGVIRDLEAMKKAGINRAFIGNIYDGEYKEGRNVPFMSDEWWSVLHTALKKATELDIEIGIFNSPGWSQSGGPWNKEEQSMRYLTASEIIVQGSRRIDTLLPQPPGSIQDVKLIAYPAISADKLLLNASSGKLLPKDSTVTIDLNAAKPFTARSLTVYPMHTTINADFELQALINGSYQTISRFTINWYNLSTNVGFQPFAPVSISFNETTASAFRIVATNHNDKGGIAELELSSAPKVENYAQKTFAKMFQEPLPQWDYYMWRIQPETTDPSLVIQPGSVIDITKHLGKDGRLNWQAPAGKWVIMRTGMAPTGVTNSPAAPEATGPEIDKLSKQHLASHFDAFIGKILKRIPATDRKTFRVVVQDSYETGGQNFTDHFLSSFHQKFGYDPLPYLPAYFGQVVGSQLQSDRFLWDVRRHIADLVAYEYVGGFRELCHQHGLRTWLENYGHWGFPAEFLQYGGQSDEVAGEFWAAGDLGNIENRAASSCAHIYGKNLVSAESSTSAGAAYSLSPAGTKQRTDRFFTEGINNTLLHLYIQQPDTNRFPGTNAWFGTEFSRTNTWFSHMDLYTDYLKRCNYMLQQGLNMADVAYFIGEDVPKMTGIQEPALPRGYQFDYINAEVLIRDAFVKQGRITLPHGTSYRVLALPKLDNMRPELLAKIKQLVQDGAVILGNAPMHSPSLQNQPAADQLVRAMATELWQGNTNGMVRYGKGMVFTNQGLEQVFAALGETPDCRIPETTPFLYTHRSAGGVEIYFISNQSEKKQQASIGFRVTGARPEHWNAINGERKSLPYSSGSDGTEISLELDAFESAFIVFRKDAATGSAQPIKNATPIKNAAPKKPTQEILLNQPWQLKFSSPLTNPAPIQLNQLENLALRADEKLKYFSGTMIYTSQFNYKPSKKEEVLLDLGEVHHSAKVWLNGVYVGGAWTPPYRVNLSKALKKGKNELRIEVVNNWANRLIGDKIVPEKDRETRVRINSYNSDSELQPSGLTGPVKLLVNQQNN